MPDPTNSAPKGLEGPHEPPAAAAEAQETKRQALIDQLTVEAKQMGVYHDAAANPPIPPATIAAIETELKQRAQAPIAAPSIEVPGPVVSTFPDLNNLRARTHEAHDATIRGAVRSQSWWQTFWTHIHLVLDHAQQNPPTP